MKITEGVPPPGVEDIPPRYSCETDIDSSFGRYFFDMIGNVESFFSDENLIQGSLLIKVPFKAVTTFDEILFDDETTKMITVVETGDVGRRLNSIPKSGKKHILVIRLSDDDDPSGLRKVQHSSAQLSTHFFDLDNNNVVRIFFLV